MGEREREIERERERESDGERERERERERVERNNYMSANWFKHFEKRRERNWMVEE